jgi:hypothetical protein
MSLVIQHVFDTVAYALVRNLCSVAHCPSTFQLKLQSGNLTALQPTSPAVGITNTSMNAFGAGGD